MAKTRRKDEKCSAKTRGQLTVGENTQRKHARRNDETLQFYLALFCMTGFSSFLAFFRVTDFVITPFSAGFFLISPGIVSYLRLALFRLFWLAFFRICLSLFRLCVQGV